MFYSYKIEYTEFISEKKKLPPFRPINPETMLISQ